MRPTRRTIRLVFGLLVLSLIAALVPAGLPGWALAATVLSLALMIDALRGRRIPELGLQRIFPTALPLGVWSRIEIRLEHRGRFGRNFQVADFYPPAFECTGLPMNLTLDPGNWAEFNYQVRPKMRGAFEFEPAQILLTSPWGLWRLGIRAGTSDGVRVYPNFREVTKYNLMAATQQLSLLGIRKKRRRGEGREFHQLREYVRGDTLRQIDWKASSRMHKLISREYQDEQDQNIFFLIDCGQTMRAQDGDLSHFDHALNAVLLLARVALRKGDAVGLMTFSGEERWLAPRKGMQQLNQITNAIFDVQPGLNTSDFLGAAEKLLVHLKKRALLVIISNLRDEDHQELLPALRLLRRRHLVLMASMREGLLDEMIERELLDFEDSLDVAAAHDYLRVRRQTNDALKKQGVLILDVEPQNLPITSINAYLAIKSSGQL